MDGSSADPPKYQVTCFDELVDSATESRRETSDKDDPDPNATHGVPAAPGMTCSDELVDSAIKSGRETSGKDNPDSNATHGVPAAPEVTCSDELVDTAIKSGRETSDKDDPEPNATHGVPADPEEQSLVKLPPTLEDCLDVLVDFYANPAEPMQTEGWYKYALGKLDGIRGAVGAMINPNFSRVEGPRSVKAVLSYCLTPMHTGHVCNKAMILMAGQSGAGKSKTINKLFNDKTLCPTSGTKSMTRDVIEIEKVLRFPDKEIQTKIESSLIFIDIPGILDTDASMEAGNFATIFKYLKLSPDLAKREEDYYKIFCRKIGDKLNSIPKLALNDLKKWITAVERQIRPNLVLLCIKNGDNRMDGPDSPFQKTLKHLKSLDVVNTKHINFIVVVTHAMYFPETKYQKKAAELTKMIKSGLQSTFHVSSFPIVFVENKPKDYKLEIVDGFYKLPDGERSHFNLIKAMEKVFADNGDALGMRLCGWYFSDECPEKEERPHVTTKQPFCSDPKSFILQKQDFCSRIPTRFIGHGFCPITETNKVDMALLEEMINFDINGKQRSVLQCFEVTPDQKNFCKQIMFQKKEDYEENRKISYGLDASVSLSLQVDSNGKWNQRDTSFSESSSLSFLYTRQIFSAKIKDIKKAIKPELHREMENLPSTYSDVSREEFVQFFSVWGTHLVCEVGYGGSIVVDCELDSSKCSSEDVKQIQAEVQAAFTVSSTLELSKEEKKSSRGKAQNMTLSITGGTPPLVMCLQDLTPQMYTDWIASLEQSPTELEHSLRLYPYYNLATEPQSTSLKAATLAHLGMSCDKTVEDISNQKGKENMTTSVPSTRNSCEKTAEDISSQKGGENMTTPVPSTRNDQANNMLNCNVERKGWGCTIL